MNAVAGLLALVLAVVVTGQAALPPIDSVARLGAPCAGRRRAFEHVLHRWIREHLAVHVFFTAIFIYLVVVFAMAAFG